MSLECFLKEVDEVLWEKISPLPLSNSDVQNLFLIVYDDFSDGRKLRTYLLKLLERKQALENFFFDMKKQMIQLKKLKRDLDKIDDDLVKEEILLDIAKVENNLKYTKKLVSDCLHEVKFLYNIVKKFPTISREEFEKQEFEHFKKRLHSSLTEPDQVKSLRALGFDVKVQAGMLSLFFDKKSEEILESYRKELSYDLDKPALEYLEDIDNFLNDIFNSSKITALKED